MSEQEQAEALERSLLERAQRLADEERSLAAQEREQLLARARQRIAQRKHDVEARAHQQAERHYRQQVQRAELAQSARLEQLRWTLIEATLDALMQHLQEVYQDGDRYRSLLTHLLEEACEAIGDQPLIAQLNNQDLNRYQSEWQQLVSQTPCGHGIELSSSKCNCSGGVLLQNADRTIRYDNTFEGRLERMRAALQQVISEQLFQGVEGGCSHG